MEFRFLFQKYNSSNTFYHNQRMLAVIIVETRVKNYSTLDEHQAFSNTFIFV